MTSPRLLTFPDITPAVDAIFDRPDTITVISDQDVWPMTPADMTIRAFATENCELRQENAAFRTLLHAALHVAHSQNRVIDALRQRGRA